MESHRLINQDSGNAEYYTPPEIINLARSVMGGVIDLDPASSEKANITVQAKLFFSKIDNALDKHWFGNVWMNHPFSRENNKPFIEKLVAEYQASRIQQACCITFASTSESWFRPLLSFPQCYIHGRTNYFLPDGKIKKGVTKGSVVTYLGSDIDKFKSVFSSIGTVKI